MEQRREQLLVAGGEAFQLQQQQIQLIQQGGMRSHFQGLHPPLQEQRQLVEHLSAVQLMLPQHLAVAGVVVIAVRAQPHFGHQVASGQQVGMRIEAHTRQDHVYALQHAGNKVLT